MFPWVIGFFAGQRAGRKEVVIILYNNYFVLYKVYIGCLCVHIKKLAGRLPEVRSLIESADWNRAVMERGYRVLGDNEDFEYMAAQLAVARNYEERSIIYRCIELGSQGNECRIVALKETLLPVLMDAVRKETVPSAVKAGVFSMVCFLKEDTSLESFLVELEEKHSDEGIATMNRQIRHAWKTLQMQ